MANPSKPTHTHALIFGITGNFPIHCDDIVSISNNGNIATIITEGKRFGRVLNLIDLKRGGVINSTQI